VRLASTVRKCVVFFRLNREYGGTGFFVEHADRGSASPVRTKYLVTAAHVARVLGNIGFAVRANLRTGDAEVNVGGFSSGQRTFLDFHRNGVLLQATRK
jgi:hypothetical protein